METLPNKLFILLTNPHTGVKQLIHRCAHNLLIQNIIILILPRTLTIHKLESNHANGPDIALIGVPVELERLWGHIEGRTHVVVKLVGALLGFYSKPEVSKDGLALADEDVGEFEVAVDYS